MNIPIFFTFDNNYVIPAAVAFFSLLNKAKKSVFYDMHVLHSDITTDNETLLQNVVSRFKNASLEFKNTHGFLKNEWQKGNWEGHQNKNKFTLDTVIRCFAADFFPQYDKIIYSDVDIVVKEDISELWDIDLTDKYLAAVQSSLLKYCPSELSHLSPELYEKFKDPRIYFLTYNNFEFHINKISKFYFDIKTFLENIIRCIPELKNHYKYSYMSILEYYSKNGSAEDKLIANIYRQCEDIL